MRLAIVETSLWNSNKWSIYR